jgi:hypothetical protein
VATPRENFESWFVNVLDSLYPRREAGFVILMTALPLLERYLRQRAGLPAEGVTINNPRFYDELRTIFPVLRDRNQAQHFWKVYRNGLLHQGTFSQQSVISGLASHDIAESICIDQNGNFCVHPVLFAKRVLEQIANDFSTFEGASTAAPPLSTAGPYQIAPNAPVIYSTSAAREQNWDGSTPTPPPGRLQSQIC